MKADKDETALEITPKQKTELITQRMTVNQIEEAFKEYLHLQERLDKLMPDQILEIGKGKNKRRFRKKGYWRMVKKWARLGMEIIKEERIETGDDWGYLVTARVTTPDGQAEDGDGSCMASEKNVYKKDWDTWERKGKQGPPPPMKDKDGNPILDAVETAKNATVHNVRAHATTRAKNRAISDLVGFGEVSAEELPPDANDEDPKPNPQQKADAESMPIKQLERKALKAGIDFQEWVLWARAAGIKKDPGTHTVERLSHLEEKIAKWERERREKMDAASEEAIAHDTGPLDDMPPGPAEEYGKQKVSGDQIDHLIDTARTAMDHLKSAKDVFDWVKGQTKKFNLGSLEDLTIDEYEGLINILDTRTGDQPYLPMDEGRGS